MNQKGNPLKDHFKLGNKLSFSILKKVLVIVKHDLEIAGEIERVSILRNAEKIM